MKWLPFIAAFFMAGCQVASGTLVVSRADLDEDLGRSIERLEVAIFAGQTTGESEEPLACGALLDGTIGMYDPRLVPRYGPFSWDPDGDVGPEIGHLREERVVFFAQARDELCAVVAAGCSEVPLRSGKDENIQINLLQLPETIPCDTQLACVDGDCRQCELDVECDDGDECTIEDCIERTCVASPAVPDADRDGAGGAQCGGPDCDDDDPLVHPGADRRCGRAVDHDCDGVIDDTQGCGTCPEARGMVFRTSIDTPAVGLYAIGAELDDPAPHQLFVGTPSAIEVYSVPLRAPPELLGSTDYEGVEPLPPSVLGDHTIVADFGTGGLRVFSTDDLRAGDAPTLDVVGEELGTVSAVVADMRYVYIAVGAGEGSLAMAPTSGLPVLPEPETELGSGLWRNSAALDLRAGIGGGWIFGILGQYIAFAQLDPTGAVEASGSASVTEGFGWDVVAQSEWIVLAQGDRGLMFVDRGRVASVLDGGSCCSEADYTFLELPEGCSDESCENAVAVASAGEGRTLALTFTNSGPQRTRIYFVDTTEPASMRVLDATGAGGPGDPLPLSHPTATGRDIWVTGNTVYVAGKVQTEAEGTVDVFDLICD